MKSIQEIEEYCSQNNIPYKKIDLSTYEEDNIIPKDGGIKILVDMTDLNKTVITRSELFKFLKED